MHRIDITGQKFSKLLVISRFQGSGKWNCLCDCGKNVIVFGSNLKRSNTRSCGCLRQPSDETLSSKKALYENYKRTGAKKRGRSFTLNFEEFINLTQQNCHYCGDKPNQYSKHYYAIKGFFYNGLDRVNNSRGYEIDNVVPCCKHCNRAKWEKSKDEFVGWLKRCFNHLKNLGYYD